MAIDPRLLFMGGQGGAGVPNVGQSLLQGLQLSQQIRRAPLMEQLDKLRVQQAQRQLKQAEEGRFQYSQTPQQVVGPDGKPTLAFAGFNPVTGESSAIPVEGLQLNALSPEQQMANRVKLQEQLAQQEVEKQRQIEDIRTQEMGERQLAKDKREILKESAANIQQATDTIDLVNQYRKVLKELETGNSAKVRLALSQVPGFGDLKDASIEEFQALAAQSVLTNAQSLSGVLSDTDIALLMSRGPQLANTKEGNIRIIEAMDKAAKHKRKEERRKRDFIKKGGDPFDFEPKPIPDYLADTIEKSLQSNQPTTITSDGKQFRIIRE